MTYHLLDTNTVSYFMRREPEVQARAKAAQTAGDRFLLSPVVEYEVQRGALRRHAVRYLQDFQQLTATFDFVEFDRSVWQTAAEMWAFSRSLGQPIADNDLLIAAQATTEAATLVTNNVAHFALFQPLGLIIENWTTP